MVALCHSSGGDALPFCMCVRWPHFCTLPCSTASTTTTVPSSLLPQCVSVCLKRRCLPDQVLLGFLAARARVACGTGVVWCGAVFQPVRQGNVRRHPTLLLLDPPGGQLASGVPDARPSAAGKRARTHQVPRVLLDEHVTTAETHKTQTWWCGARVVNKRFVTFQGRPPFYVVALDNECRGRAGEVSFKASS